MLQHKWISWTEYWFKKQKKKKKRHRKVSIFKLLKQAKLKGDKCQNSGLGEDLVTGGGK